MAETPSLRKFGPNITLPRLFWRGMEVMAA
jgi:hypothetical protein